MGYVYRYTHPITGKWYIGSHNGKKKNYTGSGLIWQRAKKKYGVHSFIKEILYEGDDYQFEEENFLKPSMLLIIHFHTIRKMKH